MTIYELQCLNEDGNIESNGFFFYKKNAEKAKNKIDKYPCNAKYNIKQNIIEHKITDKMAIELIPLMDK